MPRRPGKIVRWTDKNGDIQKGIAYNDEQSVKFAGRIWINVIDDEFNRKKDEKTGKFLVIVKFPEDLQVIGMVD